VQCRAVRFVERQESYPLLITTTTVIPTFGGRTRRGDRLRSGREAAAPVLLTLGMGKDAVVLDWPMMDGTGHEHEHEHGHGNGE